VAGFLLGFSAGSFVVSRKIDRRGDLEGMFGIVCVLTALGGAAVLFLFQRFEAATALLDRSLPVDALTASLALAFAVSFTPAVFMGILFPLGLKIYARDIHRIGAKAGNIFFANTAGCVLGSLLTGFVLIPFAGMWNTTLLLVNLSLLIAVIMLLRGRRASAPGWAFLVSTVVMANLLVFSDGKTFHKEMGDLRVVYYAEGLSGTVTALETGGYRGLFVDGQNVSGTDHVLQADSKLLAHLPLLLNDDPQSALTVGYGTGTTSGSMLLHGVDVHAVEIEEKILEAAPLFGGVNRDSYADPGLNIVLDDARNYIGFTDERFDVIVTDVTNLKYKRNPYLYTRKYFRIMQDALAEDGIAAAWVPVGGLSFEDLQTFSVENVYEVASMLLLGEQDVDDLVAGARIHTDDRPILEFSDMHQYMMVDVAPNLGRLLEYQREDRLGYFSGTGQQMETLDRYFIEYTQRYRDYVEQYDAQMGRHGG
jgi:spermidine synthase